MILGIISTKSQNIPGNDLKCRYLRILPQEPRIMRVLIDAKITTSSGNTENMLKFRKSKINR